MAPSIAAVAPILTELIELENGDLWLMAETADPVGSEYLSYLLTQLPPDEAAYVATHADLGRAVFAAPDEGDVGFVQAWTLPHKVLN